jgi:predicted nucleic acid-binding protein
MTVLVDTCGWIEWLTDDALAEQFRPYLRRSDALLVPTAVQYELYKWVRREMDHALALQIVALTEQSRVVPLSTALALSAADFAIMHKLAFADAIVYATARQADAQLITSDSHFEGLPDVIYFPKQTLT